MSQQTSQQRSIDSAPRSNHPPEGRFWRRYSRHHELPLSTAGSVLVHGMVVGVLALVGVAVLAIRTPPPVEWGVLHEAGGGDDKPEPSEAAGSAQPGSPREVAELHSRQPATPHQEPNLVLPDPRPKTVRLPIASGSPTIDQDVGAFPELVRQSKELQQKLLQRLGQGPGSGGLGVDGRGAAKGPDAGGGPGPDFGRVSNRQKRLLRWTLIFNTATGDDYRRQLSALGAILAVPQPNGGYLVFRDLKQTPGQGKIEDLSSINRIFWIDEKSESVAALASALGIRPVPSRVVAFFPQSLEDELLRKELSFRGRREEQIRDTRFEVRSEHGKYVPVVTQQGAN